MTCFNEVAEKLIGHSAQELQEIKKNDDNEFNRIIDDVNFRKYDFRIRAKVDTYQVNIILLIIMFILIMIYLT